MGELGVHVEREVASGQAVVVPVQMLVEAGHPGDLGILDVDVAPPGLNEDVAVGRGQVEIEVVRVACVLQGLSDQSPCRPKREPAVTFLLRESLAPPRSVLGAVAVFEGRGLREL